MSAVQEAARPPEVVVPIHNAADLLEDCLDALARTLPDGATVQLVDDASTEAGVAGLLAAHPLVRRLGVQVLRQDRNLGFVATVNAAVARAPGDVILLNSDTRVTPGWLERLLACADSDPTIASVTPWSNNAEICSLPDWCRNNQVPADPDAVALALAGAGRPEYPSLPTAVGFCMFLRRAAWDQVGDFDVATFGRGYGEENDWCLRATAFGWRHALCDDAYVVHVGGASFAATGHRPGGGQLQRLCARYPHYNALIADFIRSDPYAARRKALLADPALAAALRP
ncbi:MAG: glycosyltransferase [Xanthomonadales bacterium]|nr:glycosyltransferase [Xanthomonadales bacterium]